MARNKLLKLVDAGTVKNGQGVWDVVDRRTGQKYAMLYLQNYGGYKFRLDNYSHRLSKTFPTEAQALLAIESEVF